MVVYTIKIFLEILTKHSLEGFEVAMANIKN